MNDLVLRFFYSLTLCDHMGEVHEAIETFAEKAGLNLPHFEELRDLRNYLRSLKIQGIYGEGVGQ